MFHNVKKTTFKMSGHRKKPNSVKESLIQTLNENLGKVTKRCNCSIGKARRMFDIPGHASDCTTAQLSGFNGRIVEFLRSNK
jgi:hypothetical protein